MSGCVTSCEPCTGDPCPGRAGGGVLAECVCGTHREHHRPGARREKGSMTALASGSSSAAALLKLVNPSIATISIFSRQVSGCEASQVLKTCLERPRIHDQEPAAPLRSWTGVTSKMTVTYLSPYGVCRYTCLSTPMTRMSLNRAGSLISRRWPSPRTAVLAALPGHA